MSKQLVFAFPRTTVSIFTRGSRSSAAAATGDVNSKSKDDDATPPVGTWVKTDLEFPVHRVYCVGRNYRAHALEMGGDPDREPPFFFQKPPDAVVGCDPGGASTAPRVVPYPPATSSLHFEAELIVAIGKGGLRIAVEDAMDHVYGYSVGCDLTRRDVQAEAKRMRRPWDAAKGFDFSCPMSPVIPKGDIDLDGDASIQLKVNDSICQQSTLDKMIYSVPEIISNLSQLFRLHKGDLILTGTPEGVSDLNVGDRVSTTCGDLIPCEFEVGEPE